MEHRLQRLRQAAPEERRPGARGEGVSLLCGAEVLSWGQGAEVTRVGIE